MIWLAYFAVTFVVFMGIDLIWLGFVAKNIYRKLQYQVVHFLK